MIEILTALLVIITGLYAFFTFKILKANEQAVRVMAEQNEALTRPYITIRVSNAPGAIYYLHITNSGQTAAKNLRLRINKDFYCFGDKKPERNIKNSYAFTNKLNSFAPKSEIVYCLGQGAILLGDKLIPEITPLNFKITSSYSYGEKTVKESTTIDLKQFKGNVLYSEPSTKVLAKISDLLKEQNKILEKVIKQQFL